MTRVNIRTTARYLNCLGALIIISVFVIIIPTYRAQTILTIVITQIIIITVIFDTLFALTHFILFTLSHYCLINIAILIYHTATYITFIIIDSYVVTTSELYLTLAL